MRRAIAIVRVSQSRDDGVSPAVQRDRVADIARREGLDVVATLEELDVSGSRPLAQRPGLLEAVERVEAQEADVIIVAYFDRLVRSLTVQAELLARVEKAGGRVLAADVGEISHETAAKWLNATMLGMVAEYHNRITAEKTRAAQVRAVKRGIPPIILPPGLRRDGDMIVIDAEPATVVAEAVAMRAGGETIKAIRAFLAENGIERSYHGTQSLLRSRLLVGEIVFGELRGECPAIVDRGTWDAAQAVVVARGGRAVSDRLLARLGVLRCGTCGARMVVGSSNNGRYVLYRCPPVGDCPRRVTISAELVERLVVERVREALADVEGRAAMADQARAAEARLEAAQEALDALIRAFAAVADEPVAVERLAEARASRDRARDEFEHLGGSPGSLTISAADDWERLSLDGRRAVIRAVVARVVVTPGRGAGRVRLDLFGQ